MKLILLGITRLLTNLSTGRRPTGIDRVIIAYLQHYKNNTRGVVQFKLGCWHYDLVLSPQATLNILNYIDLRPNYMRIKILFLLLKQGFLPTYKTLPDSFLINIEPARFDGHTLLKKHPGIICLFMIHDLIPLSFPEYSPPIRPKEYRSMVAKIAENAQGILTNSVATLEELRAFTLAENQKLPPSLPVLLGSHLCFQSSTALAPSPIPLPYFVVIGTIEPRKNHLMLLQIWRHLANHLKERTPRLVIIGQRGWELENIVDFLERCDVLKDVVIECTVNDNQLVHYLGHAQALLFPSFAEGYGIPLIEALALKVPVIASALPVFKEIAGIIPEYIDPLDSITWLNTIIAYTDNENEQRVAQLKRLANYNPPTWQEHFEKVAVFLEFLLLI